LPFSSNIKDLSLPDTILPILVILIPVVLEAFLMILAFLTSAVNYIW